MAVFHFHATYIYNTNIDILEQITVYIDMNWQQN